MPASRYDLIVVGLGLSTAPLLDALSPLAPTKRILVIERGSRWDVEAPTNHADEWEAPSPEHVYFTGDGERGAKLNTWWAPQKAGGGSLVWYGQLSRFAAIDLRMRQAVAHFTANAGDFSQVHDWPIGWDALRECYEAIEKNLLPFGSSYGHDAEAYHALECRHFEERAYVSHFERTLIAALSAKGFHPYVGQTCLGGRAWARAPVDPTDLSLRPAHGALAHRRNWFSRINADSRGIEIVYGTRVLGVMCQGGSIRAVRTLLPDGSTLDIEAPLVVLGCGTLETVRLLKSSNVPDPFGRLGRLVTFTTEAVAYVRTDIARSHTVEDIRAARFASLILKEHYTLATPDLIKGGKISIYDALLAETPQKHSKNLALPRDELEQLIAHEEAHYTLKLSFKGESIPWARKYVELFDATASPASPPPAHIYYDPHPHDIALMRFVRDVFHSIAAALPGGEVISEAFPRGKALVSAHQHGGVTFGADPAHSCLDSACEHHFVRGLFVVDGSVMPTSGATNSSLTIMANALRVARFVSQRLAAA